MEPPIPLERTQALTQDAFVESYLARNRPVIVTDAMQQWDALRDWSPAWFREHFGDEIVQIYDDLFFMVSTRPLRHYLDRFVLHAGAAPAGPKAPYIRWYSRQDARDAFPWSDDVFARLAPQWSRPYFMPPRDLLLPFADDGARDPVHAQFPARGIFISACGARTRLHVDPWASDALLCQVHGQKRFLLFAPADVEALTRDGQLVDIRYDAATDTWTDPPVRPYADDCLQPGEIILIPAGWAHAFQSTSPSISLTWNFVHRRNAARLARYVERGVPAGEAQSFAYFFGPEGQAWLAARGQIPHARALEGAPFSTGGV
ncbi:MAG: cupin-like domain-containing protein [Burkholderiales bacterium]